VVLAYCRDPWLKGGGEQPAHRGILIDKGLDDPGVVGPEQGERPIVRGEWPGEEHLSGLVQTPRLARPSGPVERICPGFQNSKCHRWRARTSFRMGLTA